MLTFMQLQSTGFRVWTSQVITAVRESVPLSVSEHLGPENDDSDQSKSIKRSACWLAVCFIVSLRTRESWQRNLRRGLSKDILQLISSSWTCPIERKLGAVFWFLSVCGTGKFFCFFDLYVCTSAVLTKYRMTGVLTCWLPFRSTEGEVGC